MKRTLIAVPLLALAAACTTTSPDVIRLNDAQRMSRVEDATVLSVRPVKVDGSQGGIGATAGAVVGGVAGSTVGGHRDNIVGGVLGAVVGGVVGNAVERQTTSEDALEIIVQLRNGERRAIVQAQGSEAFVPGEPVLLISTGGRTRVSRAPAVVAPGQPMPPMAPMAPPPATTTPIPN